MKTLHRLIMWAVWIVVIFQFNPELGEKFIWYAVISEAIHAVAMPVIKFTKTLRNKNLTYAVLGVVLSTYIIVPYFIFWG